MEEPKIKPQLQLFAINYSGKCAGNAERSAIEAGYSKSYARGNAHKLVARKDVQEYIKYLNSKENHVRDIMELLDIQEFWTECIKNKNYRTSDRIRASELLAKSKGAFLSEW